MGQKYHLCDAYMCWMFQNDVYYNNVSEIDIYVGVCFSIKIATNMCALN